MHTKTRLPGDPAFLFHPHLSGFQALHRWLCFHWVIDVRRDKCDDAGEAYVGQIDAQLLKAVVLKPLESKNIEEPDPRATFHRICKERFTAYRQKKGKLTKTKAELNQARRHQFEGEIFKRQKLVEVKIKGSAPIHRRLNIFSNLHKETHYTIV